MSKKKKIIILASSVGAVVCILLAVVIYLTLGSKYRSEFFPNTTINGVDCSNLTIPEAEKKILASIEDYTLEIHFRGGDTESISGADFDFTYHSDGSIQSLLEQQDLFSWLSESRKEHTYTIATSYTYDEELLAECVNELPPLQTASMTAPADARVEYKDNQYTVIDAIEGNTLDPGEVLEAVTEAITGSLSELDLEKEGLYAKPAISSDDEGLAAQAALLNEFANAHVTYNLPDGSTAELTPDMLRSWLVQNEDGTYTRDEAKYEENLRNFVTDLETKTTATTGDPLFDTTLDGTISIPYGELSTYTGYQMDTEGELAALKTQIAEHQIITREPVYLTKGGGTGNHGVGDTYVELNLSRQHLWYYQDGALVFDTNIVSGSMSTWRYTPPGWYKLASKSSPHTMKGEIDPATNKPIYTAKCTYWMNFIPSVGIGFHDYGTGRSDWSSSAYIYNGSHGCINMHMSDAATLYGMLEVGTPVIVYYSEPFTLRKELSPAEKYAQNGGGSGSSTPTQAPDPTQTPAAPDPTQPPATPNPTQPPATPDPTQTPEPTDPPVTIEPTDTPEPSEPPVTSDPSQQTGG